MSDDFLHRFQLERAGVRGALARLDAAWQTIRDNTGCDGALAELLGQTLAASALLSSSIKFEGSLSIHLRDSGPLRLLFAECTHDGHVRGIARHDGLPPTGRLPLAPGARLAITIENTTTETRYQGLVPVEKEGLAAAFEDYFVRSEQLPTRIVLAATPMRCAGMLLQEVARSGGLSGDIDEDGWNRVGHLLDTLTDSELLELPPEQLLLRLFHEEDVRLQPAQPLAFACTCSRERVDGMLRALGREEADSVLAEQGSIEVVCEFCNRRYVLDDADVDALFADEPPAGEVTVH